MRPIYLDNDFDYTRDMTQRGVAISGLTLSGTLSQTRGGAAINAALTVSMPEVGTTAKYRGTVSGTTLRTWLASLIPAGQRKGPVIFEIVTGSGYADVEELQLFAWRHAGE